MGGKRERKPQARDFTVLTSQVWDFTVLTSQAAPLATSEGSESGATVRSGPQQPRSAPREPALRGGRSLPFPSGLRASTSGRGQVRVGSFLVTMGAFLCVCGGFGLFLSNGLPLIPPASPACRSLEHVPLRPPRSAAGELPPTHRSRGPTAEQPLSSGRRRGCSPSPRCWDRLLRAAFRRREGRRWPRPAAASPPGGSSRGTSGRRWRGSRPWASGTLAGTWGCCRWVGAGWCRPAARLPASWLPAWGDSCQRGQRLV